jgi:hypothetical protein
MSYDRYDSRRGWREPRSRFMSDNERRDRFDRDDPNDRGFFERAGDEVASWFGDEEAERRRQMDARRERYDDDGRGSWAGDDNMRYDRQARFRDEGYRRPYTGRFSGSRGPGSDTDYRPFTGDYGRSGYSERYGAERAHSHDRWDRGTTQRESTGYSVGSADPQYSEWRRRQMDELDRDYDDYRRQNQSRFDSEFSSWRTTRQTKRGLLGQIREHMQVVGSDEEQLGTVDKVRGDRVILAKSDSDDGKHHSLNCTMIDRVEGDRVILDKPAAEAKRNFSDESRDRALFERDDNREAGPHMLNRSFSGTY